MLFLMFAISSVSSENCFGRMLFFFVFYFSFTNDITSEDKSTEQSREANYCLNMISCYILVVFR